MEVLLDRISDLRSADKAAYLDIFMDVCVEQMRLDALLLKVHKLKQQEKKTRRVGRSMLEPSTSGENQAQEKQKEVVSEILAKDHPVRVVKLPQPAAPPRDTEVVEVKEELTCTEEDPGVLPLQEHDPLAIKLEPVPWQPSGSQEEPQPQESHAAFLKEEIVAECHAVYIKEEIDIKEEDIQSFNTEEMTECVTDRGESLFQGPLEDTEELPLKRRKVV